MIRSTTVAALAAGILVCAVGSATAQLTDVTQAPNPINAGIRKSFQDEVGAGVGNVLTPGSSTFIIQRDPGRAVRRGRQIFQRKFTLAQGQGPRHGDGVGNIGNDGALGAGLADSCAACHGRPRGSAGAGGDVVTRPDSRDAPHLFGLGLQEQLGDEITKDLRAIRDDALVRARLSGQTVTRLLRSKGIGYGTIKARPNGTVDTAGVRGINADLRVRPFFAEGSTISIREFLIGAFNNEMGLQAADPCTLAASAHAQVCVTPGGMVLDGAKDAIEGPRVPDALADGDGDGVVNEIPTSIVDHLEIYLLNYFKPGVYRQTENSRRGLEYFKAIQCTSCHIQDLTIDHDRRVADVETAFDAERGIFNRLFATAATRFVETDDGSGFPTLKRPKGERFVVRNIFSDFKRHDVGPKFYERNYDGTTQKEFMTEALWGVATTGPYGHDGRSINLREVILRHGGEAAVSRNAFASLHSEERNAILEFLETLVLFPPDDTASNLDPGDSATPGFPQAGHGSIKLTVLFNDPSDVE